MSASGGKVSLFNMMTFKVHSHGLIRTVATSIFLFLRELELQHILQVMTTFMSPPPAATFLAFHPQDNNIIAIGMEDSSIQIYNVRVDEVSNPINFNEHRSSLVLSTSQTICILGAFGDLYCFWKVHVILNFWILFVTFFSIALMSYYYLIASKCLDLLENFSISWGFYGYGWLSLISFRFRIIAFR